MRDQRHTMWKLARAPVIAWAALCGLLIATVLFAYIPLGSMNLAISLSIASAKAIVIGLIFMELAQARSLIVLASTLGFAWLLFMFLLIFVDYLSR